jgi:hypothetical protein
MLFPVLVAFAANAPIVPPSPASLIRDVVVIGLAVVLLWCALRVLRVPPAEASVTATVMAGVLAMYPVLRGITIGTAAHPKAWFGIACVALSVVLGVWVLRSGVSSRPRAQKLTREIASIVTILLIGTFGVYYGRAWWAGRAQVTAGELASLELTGDAAARPDVYHIVFDGFGRPDVLRERYGLDLSDLIEKLRSRGFQISATDGAANYVQTTLSLSSVLNANYVNDVGAPDSTSRLPLYRLVEESPVIAAFKRAGYEFTFIGSDHSISASHPLADRCECVPPLIGEFESSILQLSIFNDTGLGGLDYKRHRDRIRSSLATLESLPETTSPRYVLAHIMAPHPPFVFDAEGRDIYPNWVFSFNDGTTFRGSREEYHRGYRDQASYIAARLVRVVDGLLRSSASHGREAVIIMHGDHGPRWEWDLKSAQNTDPSESVPVFFAIRWGAPGPPEQRPRSLVNIYRAVLSQYFRAGLDLLPDRAFVSSFDRAFDFIEVDPQHLPRRSETRQGSR